MELERIGRLPRVTSHVATRMSARPSVQGIVALSSLLAQACLGGAPASSSRTAEPLVITNVTIIDGTDAPPFENAAMLIRGNRIVQIGRVGSLSVPDDVQLYDAVGQYVIPGLWDMHTHVLWQPFVADGFLQLFIVNGVTGIRDMGGTLDVLGEVRPGGRYDAPTNPRIVAAGPWLNEFEIDPRVGIAVASPESAHRAVRQLAEADVDFIKVYLSLERDVFLAIQEEAETHGLPVAGHVPQGISSREASDLGMRSIEHMRVETGGFCAEVGPTDCDALLAVFRRNSTWQTPTLVVRRNGALLDWTGTDHYPGVRYAPRYLRDEWNDTRARRLATESFDDVRRRREVERDLASAVHRAGVPILAGSDAGDLYSVAGFSLHEELGLLVEVGLSPAEALRTATSEAAAYLAATDSLGAIGEGKLADLVLLGANPLEDIGNTRKIRAVVRNGRLYGRAELDQMLRRLAELAGSR